MNDDAYIIKQSLGYLFQEMGLGEVLLYRPHGLMERNGRRQSCEIDEEIRNRGWAYVLQGSETDPEFISLSDGQSRYVCVKADYDCTDGEFFLTFRPETFGAVLRLSVFETRIRFMPA